MIATVMADFLRAQLGGAGVDQASAKAAVPSKDAYLHVGSSLQLCSHAAEDAALTEEERDARELAKARAWDEFKDDNPFGHGNSKLRPCS